MQQRGGGPARVGEALAGLLTTLCHPYCLPGTGPGGCRCPAAPACEQRRGEGHGWGRAPSRTMCLALSHPSWEVITEKPRMVPSAGRTGRGAGGAGVPPMRKGLSRPCSWVQGPQGTRLLKHLHLRARTLCLKNPKNPPVGEGCRWAQQNQALRWRAGSSPLPLKQKLYLINQTNSLGVSASTRAPGDPSLL